MLDSFEVLNYKPLKHIRIQDLTPITVIGGLNGSGKTSLLEAMFLYFDRAAPESIARHLGLRGVPGVRATPQTVFETSAYGCDSKRSIQMRAEVDGVVGHTAFEFLDDGRPIYSDIQSSSTAEISYGGRILVKHSSANETEETASVEFSEEGRPYFSEGGSIPAPTVKVTYMGSDVADPHNDAMRFGAVDVSKRSDLILESMREFDPRVESLSAVPDTTGRSVLHVDIGLKRKIPLPMAGQGLQRLVSILCAMAHPDVSILFLDEIGTGVHYSMMERALGRLVNASLRFDCQLITTTHSYECLSAFSNIMNEYTNPPLTYIRLERTGDEVDAISHDTHRFRRAIESGWELR